jgi:hypothetical protein
VVNDRPVSSSIVVGMQEGNRRDYSDPMLVSPQVRIPTEDRNPELNTPQRQAVDEIFLSREKVVGLDGIAGAGKPQQPSSPFCDRSEGRAPNLALGRSP